MKRIVFLGLLLAATPAARAELYIGAAATSTSSTIETAVDDFESDELGWKAYVGYNFLRFLSVEAGYRDLGNFSDGSAAGSIDIDAKAIDGSARAFLPLLPILNVYARLGYANISYDGEVDLGGSIEDFDEDDWELYYGLGAEVNIGKRFAIRAEWEQYDVSDDLNTFSLGALYRF